MVAYQTCPKCGCEVDDMALCCPGCLADPPNMSAQAKRAHRRIDGLAKTVQELRSLQIALAESVKLQAHYASLLNMWDGGQRMVFADSSAWIARLKEIGKLK